MSDTGLAEIRVRVDNATEGPWVHLPPWKTVPTTRSAIISPNGDIADHIEAEADAEFIAHSRVDIPALIGQVERLRVVRNVCLKRANRAEAALARVRDLLVEWERRCEHYRGTGNWIAMRGVTDELNAALTEDLP